MTQGMAKLWFSGIRGGEDVIGRAEARALNISYQIYDIYIISSK